MPWMRRRGALMFLAVSDSLVFLKLNFRALISLPGTGTGTGTGTAPAPATVCVYVDVCVLQPEWVPREGAQLI